MRELSSETYLTLILTCVRVLILSLLELHGDSEFDTVYLLLIL